MPIFFMNTRDGDNLALDPEGSVLAELDIARQEALSAAREMVIDLIRSGRAIDGQCIEITDESGTVRETVRFRDVIKFV